MFDSDAENPDGYFLAVPSTGQVVGHLTDVTKFPKRRVSNEPCFVKYYSQAIGALFGVGFTAMKVFMSLAKRMEYADNGQVVFLSPQRRKNIQSELGIGKSSFDKALRTLRDSGLVVRVENNVYVLNPAIVGRGDWNKISNIHTLIDFKNGEIANGFEYDKADDSVDW